MVDVFTVLILIRKTTYQTGDVDAVYWVPTQEGQYLAADLQRPVDVSGFLGGQHHPTLPLPHAFHQHPYHLLTQVTNSRLSY